MKIRLIAVVTLALLATPSGSGSAPETETETETPAETKKQKAWEEEMEDFLPSEEVPADSAISFPVDI